MVMENFYEKLKQIQEESYIRTHIKDFEMLEDEDIKKVFEDRNIPFEWKEIIVELGYNRINKLPFHLFLSALEYIEKKEVLASKYSNRINSLSYEEMITLLYEANLSEECLITVTEMASFKRYLSYEQETKIGTKIQNFVFLKDLYLSNNDIEKLRSIKEEIHQFLLTNEMNKEDLASLINDYLSRLDSSREDNLSLGISMIGYALKNHVLLSDTMITFYILSRIKELGLEDMCENILSDPKESSTFGYYQASTKTLCMYSNYLKTRFAPIFKENKIEEEKDISDFLNLIMIDSISHELGHVFRNKEVEKISTMQDDEQIGQSSYYYWYKNGLVMTLKTQKYEQFHDQFIEENRADLFMIFDSEKTIQKYFKDCFSKEQIQNLCRMHANQIVRFYTEKKEGKWYMKSPTKKFDEFCHSFDIRDDLLPEFPKTQTENTKESIMKNLLLGDHIPLYLLKEIQKIASGKIETENIYINIEEAIMEKENDPLEKNRKRK